MTPITPNGTLTRCTLSPLGSVRSSRMRPSGDGSVATLRVSAAIPFRRSSLSRRRSYIGFALSMRERSIALASSTSGMCFSKASAIDRSTSFISSCEHSFNRRAAAFILSLFIIIFFYFFGAKRVCGTSLRPNTRSVSTCSLVPRARNTSMPASATLMAVPHLLCIPPLPADDFFS